MGACPLGSRRGSVVGAASADAADPPRRFPPPPVLREPPPIETVEGWLVMYHGVHATGDGPIYRVGLALLDLEDPRIVLHRTDEWVFGPQEPYEITGDVGKVVFPCGWTLDEPSDQLTLYYGAADSVISMATASFANVLARVMSSPRP